MSAAVSHPLTSPGFWSRYLITARPYLFFVSGAAGLVGIALVPNAPLLPASAVFLVAFLSYGLGQALTDVFQTDTDALSSPYRPLVRGEIGKNQVLAVSLAGLGICAAVLAMIQPLTLILAMLAVAGLATYTPMKRRPWLGPPWNSWIVAILPAIAALSLSEPIGQTLLGGQLYWAMASCFFTYAIFVIIGYLKDVEADRATNYRTMCVVFGRKASVMISVCCLALGTAASAILVRDVITQSGVPAMLIWIAGFAILVRAHVRGWQVKADAEAHHAVADSVRGFVVIHLGEAAIINPALLPVGLLLWLAFEAALKARPAVSQV